MLRALPSVLMTKVGFGRFGQASCYRSFYISIP
jgi:hypothetical protein